MVIFVRTLIFIVIAAIVGTAVFIIQNAENRVPSLSYNDFLEGLDNNEIVKVRLRGGEIFYTDSFGRQFTSFSPDIPKLVPRLLENNVIITGDSGNRSPWWTLLYLGLPVTLILIVWYGERRSSIHGSELFYSCNWSVSGFGKKLTLQQGKKVLK